MSESTGEHQEFGTYLATAIKAAGYRSPTALAREADLSPSVLLRAVNGETVPNAATLRRIAPLLHVPATHLIKVAYPDGVDTEPDDAFKSALTRITVDVGEGVVRLADGVEPLGPVSAEVVDLLAVLNSDTLSRHDRQMVLRMVADLADLALRASISKVQSGRASAAVGAPEDARR